MDKEQFRDAQAALGFTNKHMAKALGVGLNTVEKMRMGTRVVSPRSSLLVRLFTGEITAEAYLNGIAMQLPRKRRGS